MYKLLFTILFFLTGTIAFSQTYSTKKLIGNWEGTDTKNNTGKLTFIDSVNVIIYPPGQGNKVRIYATYTIDSSKNPMLFNVLMPGKGGSVTIKGLLKFLSNDKIKWQTFIGIERTNDFLESKPDDIIVLARTNK